MLSRNKFNAQSETVIAAAITSQPQRTPFPFTLELVPNDLPKRSWVKISQVRTLSRERIGERLGRASPEETRRVVYGLLEILSALD